jgi:hypothetical protein
MGNRKGKRGSQVCRVQQISAEGSFNLILKWALECKLYFRTCSNLRQETRLLAPNNLWKRVTFSTPRLSEHLNRNAHICAKWFPKLENMPPNKGGRSGCWKEKFAQHLVGWWRVVGVSYKHSEKHPRKSGQSPDCACCYRLLNLWKPNL